MYTTRHLCSQTAMIREIEKFLAEKLSPREIDIMKRRYGLFLEPKIQTREQVALELGTSKVRIVQIEMKIASKMDSILDYKHVLAERDDLKEKLVSLIETIDIVKANRGINTSTPERPSDIHYTPVETLELSPRTLNALINGDIGSIELLLEKTKPQIRNLRGFGSKAFNEVCDALKKKGIVWE